MGIAKGGAQSPSEATMSEPLVMRTLQLPASGSTPFNAAPGAGSEEGADFQALLAQQLGAAATTGQPGMTGQPGEASQPEDDVTREAASGQDAPTVDPAALALPPGVVAVQAVPAPGITLRTLDAAAFADGAVEAAETKAAAQWTSAADAVAGEAAAEVAVEAEDPTITVDAMRSQPEQAAAGDAAVRPDPLAVPGMERRTEPLLQPAAASGSLPDEPVSIARRSFASDVGERVLWMATNNRQVAELRVDPPQLGPVEVRLSISGEQASLTLVAANAGVREALQASIPRLQDMIQSIGLELGSVSVGSDSSAQYRQDDRQRDPGSPRHDDATIIAETRTWAPSRMAVGLVDTYA